MVQAEQAHLKISESSVDELRKLCREHPGTLYAILDACDEPRVPKKVEELGPDRAVSLYHGAAKRDYWAIAPYLVQVDEQLLDWIVANLWNDSWGIFAVCERSLAELRRHFRQFLIVQNPGGDEMYFCFYDPRVLVDFLPSCTRDELIHFMGPLRALAVGKGQDQIMHFEAF